MALADYTAKLRRHKTAAITMGVAEATTLPDPLLAAMKEKNMFSHHISVVDIPLSLLFKSQNRPFDVA